MRPLPNIRESGAWLVRFVSGSACGLVLSDSVICLAMKMPASVFTLSCHPYTVPPKTVRQPSKAAAHRIPECV